MREIDKNIRETNISGKKIRQSGVHGIECPALAARGIFSVGHARISGRYQVVRLNPDFDHLTFCCGGSGRALIRGKWVNFASGDGVFSPRHSPHGTLSNRQASPPWILAWIVFDRHWQTAPRLPVEETLLVKGGFKSPLALIEGLEQELALTGDAVAIHHWVELIHRYVERVISRKAGDARLSSLWEKIRQDLSQTWTLDDMARKAGLSEGHFRRLCRAELGFSPQRQLARLRMQRVSLLLSTTDLTLEQISAQVGYGDAFSLSAAYRRHAGISPRQFRESLRKPIK